MNAYLESLSRQAGLTAVTDIGHQSVEEFYRQARENLTYQEACTLHEASQQALKRNRMYEASLLAHAAPWLPSALQVGMRAGQDTRDYDGEFGDRSSRYTVPGSVSSMFSPAAYLTELYSQARDLHPAKSTYHLDVRRPDLKELILSQENLDAEVTVLSLSNEWLLRKAQEVVEGGDGTPQEVLNFLSKLRTTGVTPHHDAFERLHHGLLAKDPGFKYWHTYAGVTDLMEPVARRALRSNIDPELRKLLLEEITDPDTIDAVYALNFNKISPAQFLEPDHLKRYYELSDEEVAYCLEFVPPDTEPSLPPLMEWFQRNRTKCIQFLINEVRYEIGIKMGYGALGELILEPQSSPGTYQCRFRSYIPEDRLTVRKSELLLHWSDGSESAAILLSDDWRDFLYSNRWYESSLTLDIRPYAGRVNRASIRITETNGAVRSLAETELFTLNEVSLSDLVQIDKYRALALNRLIRLSRASGLDLRVAVTAVDRYLPSAVNSIEWEARYAISPEERLVLDGAEIPTRAPTGTPSLFDRLFNTPPLNGVVLEPASEPPIVLDFRVADPRKDILKRAFVVDDTGLHLLAQLYFGVLDPIELKHNLATLSGLWRVCMVARVHGLSLPELAVLLLAMDEVNLGFENVLVDALAERIDRIHATCEWLKAQGWSVFDALARTTSAYDGQSTPEWSQLLSVLHAAVESAKGSATVEQKVAVLAPHVAAGLLLPGARAGEVTLLWADRLPKPNDMTIEAFWEQVAQDPTDASAIAFVQVLAQLALIQQDVQLPVAALEGFVATPQTLYGAESPRNVLGHDLETLQALARFAKWLQALGEHASSTLSAFLRGELTPALLAEAMQWEALRVQEAVVQAVAHDQVVDPAHLSSEFELDRVMQWVRLSEAYGLAPSKLSQLLALRYDAGESSYAKWHEAAMAVATGLSSPQSAQVHGVVDEALSAALSAYVIQHVFPDLPLMDRNGLYQHVLLDNQSSAQVTTTRIAEAIASLQFYVNSAMAGLEGADRVVMQRQFFRDWQRYNQRYSTWAGAAKLGYYPENYIEPTLRIGQTDMMDALLAQIGQSQLTSDSVGDAFLSYLNSFEEVANLDVISGYHEQIDLEQGKTYFIGEDMTEPRRYYWRSLDQNKKQATGGYPANAWTEWRKIDGIALPFESCIRPVTFKSRLYLIWLERKDIATSTQAEALPNAESYTYQIKWAYLRHDGNWSTPYSHDVTSAMAGQGGVPSPTLYVGEADNALIVMLYGREAQYPAIGPAKRIGLRIDHTMVIDAFDTASLAVMMRHRLDTLGQRHVSTPYVEPEEDVISYRVVVGAPGSIGIPYFQAHELDADLGEVSVRKVDGQLSLVCQPWGGLRWIGDLQDISKAALNFSTHHPEWVATPFTFYQISTGNNLWGTTSGLFAFAEIHDKVDLTLSWRLVTHLYDGGRQPVEEIMPSGKEGSVVMRSTRFDPGQFSDSLALEGGYAGDEQVYVFRYYDGKKIACPLSTTTRFRIENQSFDFSEHGDESGSYFALDNTLVKFKELSASFNTGDIASKTLSFALSIDFVEVRWPVTVTPLLAGALPPAMAILRDANGAQYLATEHARVRLNTLFARQLVEIAQRGIHAILSPQTQRIPEPLLGKGRYVRVVLPPPVLLGTHEVELQLKDPVSGRSQLWWRGLNVEGRQQSFDLLVPFSRLADGELVDFPQQASLVVEYRDQAYTDIGRFEFQGTSGACRYVAQAYDPVTHPRIEVLSTLSTPMDFGGANALYFWELFYYTPMMAMQRLLQERRFDEAGDWLKYVWDPSPGAERNWITRPLLEDTSWNADPLDSVDPDAVAQSDPMHYKVATFFRALDLLIARGDAAYRQLQRDTLNEAKGWYLAALKLLGTRRSFRLDEHWENPTLGEAAAPQRRQSHQRRLLQLQRAHRAQPADREANGTALTELFLPESNDVLLGYWQTIEQRLYNLRHHLSIDGQPLSLPIYTKAADPKQLLTAAVAADEGGSNLPSVELPPQRFALLLESARTLVFQLIQFGSTMQSLLERQDGEALGVLLQTQAEELVLASIRQQQKSIEELEREEESLQHTQQTVRNREARYVQLIEEDVNSGERKAMNLRRESGHLSVAVQALYLTGASVDMAPNIFGVAAGGMRWGGFPYALGNFMGLLSQIKTVEADKITQTEVYRRRRQEWEIQRDAAQGELKALEAQLKVLAIRKEAAALQKAYLQTQQAHAQAQLQFLRRKFTNEQLYSWLRGRLATIFYQFYDVAVGRCLMAERSYQWETQDLQHFVKAGAWQGNYAGLLCGEALMLNLAQMDKAYLEWDRRALEVRRTLSLAQLYAELDQPFSLATEIRRLLESGSGQVGDDRNGLSLESDGRLILRVDLTATNLGADYPVNLGPVRRIKQISVSLPAILGAYQDVQAVLSYAGGGNEVPPRGCEAIAISHGVNDNGLFQLDFNEGKYLPFEGVPISARLALSFPHAMGKQKNLLNSLNDVILHVAYTIRQR